MNQLSVRLFIFSCLVLLSLQSLAQDIDSIKKAIKSQKNDSLRAYQYSDLAEAYLEHESMNFEKVKEAAENGKALAIKFKDTLAMTFNMERLGHVLYYKGLYEQCLSLYFQILRNAEILGRLDIQARSHRMMGWIGFKMNFGANGSWVGLLVSLALTATAIFIRFQSLSKKLLVNAVVQ